MMGLVGLFVVGTLICMAASQHAILKALPYMAIQPLKLANEKYGCVSSDSDFSRKCVNSTSWAFCINGEPQNVNACPSETPVCREGNCDIPDFKCPVDYGYFPSLTSCELYYICSKKVATLVNCPKGGVYDPVARTCIRKVDDSHCHKFDCAGAKWKIITYSGDKSIYAVCDGTSRLIAISKCKDGQLMDENDQKCKVACKVEGNMAIVTDRQKYYHCFDNGNGGFEININECPAGTKFDSNLLYCTP